MRPKQTILVVDDDPEVLSMIGDLLTEAGYSVRSTVNPLEALQIAGTYAGPIHLLLTDVVMPAMGGGELAKEFHTLRPDARVLFMSAYDDVENLEQHRIRLAVGEPYLSKPFTIASLKNTVRAALLNRPPTPWPRTSPRR